MNKEEFIIERLKLMFEFNSYIFDNIMNDVDFYVRNQSLKILITIYKTDKFKELHVMNLINNL